ncbi:hypothetical protein Sjap_021626 [Stephania japonica]|uniref:Uncharacterized protein n=1 Tax=Stephania japonica TaxID=461633 RepID=A0AAP0EW57_9MAGN
MMKRARERERERERQEGLSKTHKFKWSGERYITSVPSHSLACTTLMQVYIEFWCD